VAAERFRARGITYVPAEKPKSDLYRDLLPILNAHRAELLDLPRLAAQLCSLERRTTRGGRDSIDHPPGTHDDVANAVAGAICRAIGAPRPLAITPEILAQLSNAPKYRYRPPWAPRNFD
jgi:hypothetical protein